MQSCKGSWSTTVENWKTLFAEYWDLACGLVDGNNLGVCTIVVAANLRSHIMLLKKRQPFFKTPSPIIREIQPLLTNIFINFVCYGFK